MHIPTDLIISRRISQISAQKRSFRFHTRRDWNFPVWPRNHWCNRLGAAYHLQIAFLAQASADTLVLADCERRHDWAAKKEAPPVCYRRQCAASDGFRASRRTRTGNAAQIWDPLASWGPHVSSGCALVLLLDGYAALWIESAVGWEADTGDWKYRKRVLELLISCCL